MTKWSALSIAGLSMTMMTLQPSIAAESLIVRPSQELAVLVDAHTAVSTPGRTSAGRAVSSSRPITGEQTALPVLGRAVSPEGVAWLLVMLPGRPNGTRGWIEQRGTERRATSWRIVVRTASRRLLVYRRGLLVRTFPAVVGKPATPTPHGVFFVEESVRMPAGGAGGPFALALSAHSDVLKTFEGGTGQIAIHGVAKLSGAVGTASSHGCVRLSGRDIRWMAIHIAPGVPVAIIS
jgi:lipoprotein-anchoring transpeptidase ErfK/SrfK